MHLRLVAAAGAALLLSLAVTTSAQAAPASASSSDTTFVHDNAQTDLAEITIGKIGLTRAQSSQARDLATTTIADHQAALSKLKTVAASLNLTLPDAPNAKQQADAATLKTVAQDQFDATYAQIQIAGHQLSIAGTTTELADGTNTAVKNFASGYLPVAKMHLSMAQELLKSVGGSVPSAVPAGTGGAGATTSNSTKLVQMSLGVVGLLLIGTAFTMALRRRRTT